MVHQRYDRLQAYILHRRSYRDTSLILEIFTRDHGRFSVVAKGGRTGKQRGILQLFVPLLISCSGRGEMLTLTGAETNHVAPLLQGRSLLSALYLNELLIRLLAMHDAHGDVFNDYAETLTQLAQLTEQERILRWFEKRLLQNLGYACSLVQEAQTDQAICADLNYYFYPDYGFTQQQRQNQYAGYVSNVFSGRSLLALHADKLDCQQSLRDAKRFMRIALEPLLGNKPLKSRELFIMPKERVT